VGVQILQILLMWVSRFFQILMWVSRFSRFSSRFSQILSRFSDSLVYIHVDVHAYVLGVWLWDLLTESAFSSGRNFAGFCRRELLRAADKPPPATAPSAARACTLAEFQDVSESRGRLDSPGGPEQ